jgi:hypothetical protein
MLQVEVSLMREAMIFAVVGLSRDHSGRFTRSFSAMNDRRFPPPWLIEEIGA